jgi:hypothetical protein
MSTRFIHKISQDDINLKPHFNEWGFLFQINFLSLYKNYIYEKIMWIIGYVIIWYFIVV